MGMTINKSWPSQWLNGKESTTNAGHIRNVGSNPGPGRSPGERNGCPLQYSCPGNPKDRGAWQATVHEVTKSRTRLRRLSMHKLMMKVKVKSCPALCDSMDCSLPDSSVHGILQARMLEWVTISLVYKYQGLLLGLTLNTEPKRQYSSKTHYAHM